MNALLQKAWAWIQVQYAQTQNKLNTVPALRLGLIVGVFLLGAQCSKLLGPIMNALPAQWAQLLSYLASAK